MEKVTVHKLSQSSYRRQPPRSKLDVSTFSDQSDWADGAQHQQPRGSAAAGCTEEEKEIPAGNAQTLLLMQKSCHFTAGRDEYVLYFLEVKKLFVLSINVLC